MHQFIFPILRLLGDGKFHSSVSIAKQFQCSRTVVLKAINQISHLGINLTKSRGYGYRWEKPIRWLNPDLILNGLNNNSSHFDLKIFDYIDSTNNYLLKDLKNNLTNRFNCISVVAVELQTNGRGRIGRIWYSGVGDSLTFSLRFYFEKSIASLSGLSLVIGIAITRVLRSFCIPGISLKWPNDILFNHQKLAGVLIEIQSFMPGSSYAIIGIGINFNLSDKSKSLINQEFTDLFTITGKFIDRNLVLSALLLELRNILMDFNKYNFAHFKKEWDSYHAYETRNIYLKLPDSYEIEGIVDGVNDSGALCLITNKGRKFYNVGDITVRRKQP